MYKEAIREYQSTLSGIPDWPVALAAIGYVYGVSGQKPEAEKILAKLETLSSTKYVTPYGVALVYASLNDRDKAFEWLEKAYAERESQMAFLKVTRRFGPLRSDPRFADLLRRMDLGVEHAST